MPVMIRRLTFENLPFHPRTDEIIYIEGYSHMAVNTALQQQWQVIDQALRTIFHMRFRYLPMLSMAATPEQLQWTKPDIKYRNLPLTTAELVTHITTGGHKMALSPGVMLFCENALECLHGFWYAPFPSPVDALSLQQHVITTVKRLQEHLGAIKRNELERQRQQIQRCDSEWHKKYDRWIAKVEQLKKKNPTWADLPFEQLAERCQEAERERIEEMEELKQAMCPDPDVEIEHYSAIWRTLRPYTPGETRADDDFDADVRRLLSEVQDKIEQLRLHGVSEMLLHQLVEPEIILSRMLITEDFRILLPDYDNLEIEMTPLVKAVYFLFLRHTSGIRFKQLPDYRDELTDLYRRIRGGELSEKAQRSIEVVTDPTNNSINEKCARIREAFLLKVNETYATYYFITGEKNQPKRIDLYRNLLKWENHWDNSILLSNPKLIKTPQFKTEWVASCGDDTKPEPIAPPRSTKPTAKPADTWPEDDDYPFWW